MKYKNKQTKNNNSVLQKKNREISEFLELTYQLITPEAQVQEETGNITRMQRGYTPSYN